MEQSLVELERRRLEAIDMVNDWFDELRATTIDQLRALAEAVGETLH